MRGFLETVKLAASIFLILAVAIFVAGKLGILSPLALTSLPASNGVTTDTRIVATPMSLPPVKVYQNKVPEQIIILPPTIEPYQPQPTVEIIIQQINCTTEEWKSGKVGCTYITDALDAIGATPIPVELTPVPYRECTQAEWQKLSQENYPGPSGCTRIIDLP